LKYLDFIAVNIAALNSTRYLSTTNLLFN